MCLAFVLHVKYSIFLLRTVTPVSHCKYAVSSDRSWIHGLNIMADAGQDNKSTDLSHLREELLSSSTKKRGTELENLHAHIAQSSKGLGRK